MRIVFSLLVSCVLIFSGCISLFHQGGNEIHVAVNGSDLNAGSKSAPLETIQAAAEKAMPGDTVTVHAGIYREHINPPRGGISDSKRITFQAAQGEDVTITGSEPAKGWVKESGDTWKLTLPNSYFGTFNPFAKAVLGDWFDPRGRVHHLGMVYLNGEWMPEAVSGEEVLKPMTATPLWFASVDPTSTVIRAQFPGIDPNRADVEIAKRYTVFTPEKTNIDYITVRGFKLKNAASNWAAPTSGQHGLVTAYWCKGWIIEDNEISYSRCCGIALGKYSDEWDNKRGSQKGYHATIVDALKTGGWHKDKIGGHRVRRNHIHHCGQTGIVGSLGGAFSRVENNEIHDINKQGIWGGAEMAGIKFHGAIDTVISGNHIYRCGASGGLWLDWMSQGVQVTGNLLHDNENCDIFTEVNHGPHVIANNILLSPVSYHSCSSGGAYAHNLITGGVNAAPDGRQTPYHQAHSTEVAGRRDSPLGDVRWYNNLLAGKSSLTSYDKASLPVAAAGNVFTKGAQSSTFDEAALLKPDFDPGITLTQQLDGWYLELKMDKAWATEQKRRVVGTEMLGKAVIPDLPFENADGSPLQIDTDYFGKKRDTTNPFPGPFEVKESGKQKIKVWPLASTCGPAGATNFWDEIPLSPSTKLPSVVLDDYWNSEFQRVNREVADAQNTQLIFLGDSITWCWSLGDFTGQAVWNEYYSKYKPINMGNSGDITPVMLHRVTRGNLDFADGQHPKVAVLMCGINNLGVSQSAGGREKWYLGAHCPPADIANGIRAIAQVFRRRLPGTRLIMMATLPVSDEVKRATCRQASAINAALARNDNEVAFLDLQDNYLLPDGSLNKQLFTDGTHLTPEGYRVWAKGIEPLVQKFMEAPPLKPVKIMLIGDSMTEGADSDGSYRRYLDGMLRRDGQLIDFVGSRKKHNDDKTVPANYEYDVDHEGHWGKDSAWMAENMPSLLTCNVPDVAVINLGTEDILSSTAAAESLADGIVKNIGKVVDSLRARNGKMKIVLSTVIPVAGKQDVVNLVNLKISRYVQSNSTHPCPVVLADPCKGFDASRDLAADGAHPNACGARKMARVCADVILLTAFPVRADEPADFWVRDQPGRITHACSGKEPLVLCMQGRKVVMQVQCDSTNGFSYTARFFNLQKEVEKKQALFVAGRESTPEVRVNDQPWKSGLPSSVTFDGMLTLTYPEAGGVVVTRIVYPSMTKALVIDEWQVRNTTDKPVVVTVPPARTVKPVGEDMAIVWNCQGVKAAEVEAGGVLSFSASVHAGLATEPDPAVNLAAERGARLALAEAAWRGPGRLETPDPLLDHAFALQKLHVLESPIETIKGVITHNGSLTYSPGIWANDPPEYSSPLFPFLGDAELNKASMNMYRVWLDYSREHGDAIPGCFWQPTLQVGQWERGDDAMILYGLSKFLLFQGDKAAAEEMWPLIEMCAASVLKHTTAEGIVASESDEMEGRYPTGKANLSTSSLAYGGYRLAARLAQSLGKTDVANIYDTRAAALRKAIESYFGGEVEGFKTYRYYKENTVLRGWILLPLAMGITERQNATLDAMVSDQLWPTRMQGGDILAASDRRETEWGRETYYALRVMFKAGRTEQALDLTRRVVKAQIFGARGPYPDEDAIDMLCPGSLYPRVFTEGMFGIVPTGLDSFECTPWLPKDWPRMALRDIRAFGQSWDLVVERVGDQQKVTVLSGGKTLMTGSGPAGKTYSLTFSNGKNEKQKP